MRMSDRDELFFFDKNEIPSTPSSRRRQKPAPSPQPRDKPAQAFLDLLANRKRKKIEETNGAATT
ncbi:unnamed protein product [Amoebophrya sp. A120]|nr:unnamed protein product [Amoebophrya sp. A120]|eukprot:GSA120T00021220001.1